MQTRFHQRPLHFLAAAALVLTSFMADGARAQAESQTVAFGFTASSPQLQIPLNVLVAVTGVPPTSVGGAIVTARPTRIDFLVTTLGSVVDAQSRASLPTGTTLDRTVHYERIVQTSSPSPGTTDTTVTYKVIHELSTGGESRIEISQTTRTTLTKSTRSPAHVRYEISGVTAIGRDLTTAETNAWRALGLI